MTITSYAARVLGLLAATVGALAYVFSANALLQIPSIPPLLAKGLAIPAWLPVALGVLVCISPSVLPWLLKKIGVEIAVRPGSRSWAPRNATILGIVLVCNTTLLLLTVGMTIYLLFFSSLPARAYSRQAYLATARATAHAIALESTSDQCASDWQQATHRNPDLGSLATAALASHTAFGELVSVLESDAATIAIRVDRIQASRSKTDHRLLPELLFALTALPRDAGSRRDIAVASTLVGRHYANTSREAERADLLALADTFLTYAILADSTLPHPRLGLGVCAYGRFLSLAYPAAIRDSLPPDAWIAARRARTVFVDTTSLRSAKPVLARAANNEALLRMHLAYLLQVRHSVMPFAHMLGDDDAVLSNLRRPEVFGELLTDTYARAQERPDDYRIAITYAQCLCLFAIARRSVGVGVTLPLPGRAGLAGPEADIAIQRAADVLRRIGAAPGPRAEILAYLDGALPAPKGAPSRADRIFFGAFQHPTYVASGERLAKALRAEPQ
jgi:hypothetical protein